MVNTGNVECGTPDHKHDECLSCIVVGLYALLAMMEKVKEVEARLSAEPDSPQRAKTLGFSGMFGRSLCERLKSMLLASRKLGREVSNWQVIHQGNIVLDEIEDFLPRFQELVGKHLDEECALVLSFRDGFEFGGAVSDLCAIYSLVTLEGAWSMVQMFRLIHTVDVDVEFEFMGDLEDQFVRAAGELAFKGYVVMGLCDVPETETAWIGAELQRFIQEHDDVFTDRFLDGVSIEDSGVLVGLGLPQIALV